MIKIGLVDLDTSHPAAWAPVLGELGYAVAGVYDGGTVWPAGYAQDFAARLGIPRVYGDLDEMAAALDVAVIHTCNWDLHVPRAEPFIRAGKAVLVDKPLAGNLRDLHHLLDWAGQGHRVYGGSSLRWSREVAAYLAQPVEQRGEIHTVFAGCSVDEFNYGIHAYALLCGVFGPGARSVRYLGSSTQRLVQVDWADGRQGVLAVGAQPGYLPFYATLVTTREVRHLQIDANGLYRALLEASLPYLSGQVQQPPLPFPDLVEAELIALAARKSWRRRGEPVFLSDLHLQDEGYDGYAFASAYRRQKLAA